jgi:hypothetical protein
VFDVRVDQNEGSDDSRTNMLRLASLEWSSNSPGIAGVKIGYSGSKRGGVIYMFVAVDKNRRPASHSHTHQFGMGL